MITANQAFSMASNTDYLLNHINELIKSASINGLYSITIEYVTMPKHIWDNLHERGFKVYGMIGYFYESNWEKIMETKSNNQLYNPCHENTRKFVITWSNVGKQCPSTTLKKTFGE